MRAAPRSGAMLVLWAALCASEAVCRDEIELVDGTKYHGKVMEQTETAVVFEMTEHGARIEISIPWQRVHAITVDGARRVVTDLAAIPRETGPRAAARKRSYGAGKRLFTCIQGLSKGKPSFPKEPSNAAHRITGGLYVQIGARDLGCAIEVAETGRFLVHILDTDGATVDSARKQASRQSLYGLISIDRPDRPDRLPYADCLLNVLVVEPDTDFKIRAAEMARVVCPNGVVIAAASTVSAANLKRAGFAAIESVNASGAWLLARKPWPADMDSWTHARHGADGNAVSSDMRVAPPRCVQWVAGPPQEINCMVTSSGRNFYGGILARDGFNGLRLWQNSLKNAKPYYGAQLKPARGKAAPIAAGELVLAVHGSKLAAFDGATGQKVREYAEAGTPTDLVYMQGTVVAVDKRSVRTLEADTGKLAWQYAANEPRCVVAGGGSVFLVQGQPRRGEKVELVSLDLATGKVRWQRNDYPWARGVRRMVYHDGLLACEVSTFSNEKAGNAIRVLSAPDGRMLWERTFVPGMNHKKQARAMFVNGTLWALEQGRKFVALDPRTGKARQTHKAGLCHCFPPVATHRYLISGEMDFTDIKTGAYDANRLTKQACGRESGIIPANGLLYASPKHCVCWPMLRGYVALASAKPGANMEDRRPEQLDFPIERGVRPAKGTSGPPGQEWPCYRHDAWRSGSTATQVSVQLKTIWTTELGGWPAGPIAQDWRQNPFIKGPVTSPVVAGGMVYVARPDAHELVALNARNGEVRWRATVNGRIDTPPTIHRGMCLFGTRSGWVYCLRADNGALVWRLRSAPLEKRIVAYGQLESPWPVPGSVLVVDDVAYLAAGRQSLADGGILVFAVDPSTGKVRWVERLNTVPQKSFYASNSQGVDNFDLLHREGEYVAMSQWLFHRKTGDMLPVKDKNAFARLTTGGPGVVIPRGFWSYAPRQEPRRKSGFRGIRPYLRPLVAFRDDVLVGCSEDKRSLFRRTFNFAGGEQFDFKWLTGWKTNQAASKGKGEAWRSQRLAQGAQWTAKVLPDAKPGEGIAAMVLANDTIFVVGLHGSLRAVRAEDGRIVAEYDTAAPVWDGMAAAYGCLFVSCTDGSVRCLGNSVDGIPRSRQR